MATAVDSSQNQASESPSVSPVLQRRISVRRGSISAQDPWGAHSSVNMNPSRTSSSRLTIVRVQPQAEVDDRKHRRHGSNASMNSSSSKGEPARLSFAFTSFSPAGGPSGRNSPPSPRMRPTTPGSPVRSSIPLPQHTRLSPEQLVELAHQSCHPRPSNNAPTSAATHVPVSFTPLPDSIYLPFIDRPAEVSALVTQHPTAKLFALLAQTFPSTSATSSPVLAPSGAAPSASSDPKKWTFAELSAWLRLVDRDVVDDITWVRMARACMLQHSELIWERMKGALGVPPELNVDDDELPFDFAQYLHGNAASKGRPVITSGDLDHDVFEPDSPNIPTTHFRPEANPVVTTTAASPGVPRDEDPNADIPFLDTFEDDAPVSVSPVLATPVPPPASTTASTSLHEVREEDEEDEGTTEDKKDPVDGLTGEIQGLRFSTSPSIPLLPSSFTASPSNTAQASPVEPTRPPSVASSRAASFSMGSRPPSIHGRSSSFGSVAGEYYDPMKERGPGRPLFPSSFAHLGAGPTLGKNARTSSFSHSSSGLRRFGSLGHNPKTDSSSAGGTAQNRLLGISNMPPRSEWDVGGKHEYAVSVGSASGRE